MALNFADREYHTKIIDRMDNFLRMVESRINRKIKQEGLTARATITTVADQEYYGLPADFSSLIDIEIKESVIATVRQTLIYRTPAKLNDYANVAETNDAVYYTLINNQLQIIQPQDGRTIEIVYHMKVPELTSVDDENDVSINDPDCYIAGLLVEINSFVKDANAASIWDTRFKEILGEMDFNDFKRKYNGAQLEIVSEDSI